MKLNSMFSNIFWQIGCRPKMVIDDKVKTMDIIAESILETPAIMNRNLTNITIIIRLASPVKRQRKHISISENNSNTQNASNTSNVLNRSSMEYECDAEEDFEIKCKGNITCWDIINRTNDWFGNNQNGLYYVASSLNIIDDSGVIELVAYELQ